MGLHFIGRLMKLNTGLDNFTSMCYFICLPHKISIQCINICCYTVIKCKVKCMNTFACCYRMFQFAIFMILFKMFKARKYNSTTQNVSLGSTSCLAPNKHSELLLHFMRLQKIVHLYSKGWKEIIKCSFLQNTIM